jgi:hypothetical protein
MQGNDFNNSTCMIIAFHRYKPKLNSLNNFKCNPHSIKFRRNLLSNFEDEAFWQNILRIMLSFSVLSGSQA